MNQFFKKILSVCLVASLSLSLMTPALASVALGEDLTALDVELHQDTQLTESVFWSTTYSDLREEHYITYTPNDTVVPIVTYGDTLTERDTLTQAATALEAQGYRVVAGINGDFYNTSNGLPVGFVMGDGDVKSSDAGYNAIGFYEDGTAIMGKPGMSMSLDLGYAVGDTQVMRSVMGLNKARVSTGGIYLYTYDFNDRHTTGTTEAGVDVLCSVETDLTLNSQVTLTVLSVTDNTTLTTIEPGQVVLTANAQSDSYFTDALRNCVVGSEMTLTITADEAWDDVAYAVGGLYSIVENGAVVSGLEATAAPRTAVGQTASGDLIFYTIDGRSPGYSIGATMSQVASRLIELGCVTALCLDGGGSTMLTTSGPNDETATLVNVPSDGSERAVTNQIFLVAEGGSTGSLSHFYVEPAYRYVLGGSSVDLEVTGVDTNYYPMSSSYSLSTTAGTLEGDTLYTPTTDSAIIVTASRSGRTGSATITTVESPDTISLTRNGITLDSLTVAPGDSVTLLAEATYRYMDLYADATAFTWSVDGDIGVVDAAGKFSATLPGAGSLTVSAGDTSVTIPVSVSTLALETLEDFEGTTKFSASGSGMSYTLNDNIQTVKLGRGSGTFDYTVTSGGTAILSANYTISSVYDQLNLWVEGDNSGNWLQLFASDGENVQAIDVTQLDFDGWQQLSISLPDGATNLVGLRVVAVGETTIDEFGEETVQYITPSGSIGLDQLVLSYGGAVDDDTPQIDGTLTVTDTYGAATEILVDEETGEETVVETQGELERRQASLSVTITDETDGIVAAGNVTVYVDGAEVSSSYNANSGVLTANPAFTDGDAHRITVEVVDASGNRNRMSWDVASLVSEAAFTDTQDHWAGTYVDFLKTYGVTNGYTDGTFLPDKNITRQEFAVMLYRYLGLDDSQYESLSMPFADSDLIGAYATTAVKALYSMGILNGTVGSDGQVYFNPTNSLTRAQACTMIGRTQANGYAMGALDFTDATSIPSYASDYVAVMVEQSVLGGFTDGTFRPNNNITRGQMAKILYNSL